MSYRSLALLRLGLSFVFLYAAVNGMITPEKYIKWIPDVIRQLPHINILFFLQMFFVFEIVLVIMINMERFVTVGALCMAIALLGITLVNVQNMDVLFRNVGLFFSALALYSAMREERRFST